DESGEIWGLHVEGVVPRFVMIPPGMTPPRIVRYVPPFWRGHWTLFLRYGQSLFSYSIDDQDARASGDFTGLTGYAVATLHWEWHDPVYWGGKRGNFSFGIPWFEIEGEVDRETVLTESIVLPRALVRFGSWYDEFLALNRWRFTPIFEFGTRSYALYTPLSPTSAIRSNTDRTDLGIGVGAEYQLMPFFTLG